MLFLFLSLHRMWYAHFVHTLFRDTATTEIYTLSLHDALPISIQSDPQPKEEPIEKPIIKEDRKPFKPSRVRSEEHTSELQSRGHLVCRLLLEIKNQQ